jgi:NAD(P)-dependent dehydrogenase (short-subunit alcohol dehydrogenase family)
MPILSSFEGPINALVQGASRGIGYGVVEALLENPNVHRVFATSRFPEKSDDLMALREHAGDRLHLLPLDVTDEDSILAASAAVKRAVDELHFLFNVAGILHDDTTGMAPEKSLRDLDPKHLRRSFEINAIGPILVAKHFHELFRHGKRAVFANMSARVGSIGDNRLGGWYGYRASKAAQNQFTRTFAVEMGRKAPKTIVVALHPGTVDTQLSEPFQKNVKPNKLFSVDRSVDQLFEVIDGLTPEDSGRFFDWAGDSIEW